jgi:hypothetical protein
VATSQGSASVPAPDKVQPDAFAATGEMTKVVAKIVKAASLLVNLRTYESNSLYPVWGLEKHQLKIIHKRQTIFVQTFPELQMKSHGQVQ